MCFRPTKNIYDQSKKLKGSLKGLHGGLVTILEDNDSMGDIEENEIDVVAEMQVLAVEAQEVANVVYKRMTNAQEDRPDVIVEATSVEEETSTLYPKTSATVPKMTTNDQSDVEKSTDHQLIEVTSNLNELLAVESLSNIVDSNTDLPPMLFTERDPDCKYFPMVVQFGIGL